MSATYQALAEFAQTWGLVYFVDGLPRSCSSTRSGRRASSSSTKPRACRCGRTEPWRDCTHHEIDAVTGTADHRPRMGRHPRAEHAAAALVAVDVLRHHRLVGRLLDRLSGLAAAVLLHATACSAGIRASAVVADLDALKAQRGPMIGKLAAASLRGDRGRSAAAGLRARAGPHRLRRQLRAVSRRRRRRRQGLSQSQRRRLALGRQARRHRHHDPPRRPLRPTPRRRQGAHAGLRPRRHAEACRHRGGRRLRALARRVCRSIRRPISRAGKKVFADNCAACHGDDGKGKRDARRAQSDRRRSGSMAPDKAAIVDGSGTAAAA